MNGEYPERIVCLTDETTETLYLLEEDWRIVGISGFTVRPKQAREEKNIVSGFTKANVPEIVSLKPDLVLGFSDLQANIAAELIAEGIEVHVFNQRTVAGILRMIRTVGAMIGCSDKAEKLVATLKSNLEQTDSPSASRPKVYFEEWNDPLITGIAWVSELIEVAGGADIFGELAGEPLAKNRIVADPMEVVRRNPDIIIGSWCGKPFCAHEALSRPGWETVNAVQNNAVHELDSSVILQPGPAALTEGLAAIKGIVAEWSPMG